MMRTARRRSAAVYAAWYFCFCGVVGAQEAPTGADQRVKELKTSLAASARTLQDYQWVQTTTVSYKGEEKSQKQEQCYYGPDGTVVKYEISETSESKPKRGLRGRIAEKEKGKLSEYMKNAAALVKTYVPPDPKKIQAAKDAGHLSIEGLGSGNSATLVISDYEKQGDSISMTLNLADNLPTAISVNTYLDQASDAVTLDVTMSLMEDGTVYASDIKLDAKAKEMVVDIQNGNYEKRP